MNTLVGLFETNWAQLHRKTRRRPLIFDPAAISLPDGLMIRSKPSERAGRIAITLVLGTMFTGVALLLSGSLWQPVLVLVGIFCYFVAVRGLFFPASIFCPSYSDELQLQYGFILFPRRVTLKRQGLSAVFGTGAQTKLSSGWKGIKIISLRRLDNGEEAYVGFTVQQSEDAKAAFEQLAAILGGDKQDHTKTTVARPDQTPLPVDTQPTWDAGKRHRSRCQLSSPAARVVQIQRKLFWKDRRIKYPAPPAYVVRIERHREQLCVVWSDRRTRNFPMTECVGLQLCGEYLIERHTRYEVNLLLNRATDNRVNLLSLDLDPQAEPVVPRDLAKQVAGCAGLPVLDHLTSSSESQTGLRLPVRTLSLAIAAVTLVAVSSLMFHFYGGEKASREEAESVELEPKDKAPDGAPPPKPAAERVEHSPPAPSATRPTITQTREFSGHTGAVNSVAFCTDGTRFLTGSFDRTIRLWNVDGDEPIRTYVGHVSAVCSLAVGEEVFVSGAGDGTARVWRFDGSDEIQRFDGHQGSVHVALLPDSRRLLTGGAEGTVRLWDIDSGEELHRFDVGEPVWCIAAAPSSKLKRGEAAALIGTAKGTVLLWDCVSDQEIWRLTGQTSVMDVDFALGGRHAASSHWGRKVNLLDIEKGEVIHAFTGHEGPVTSVVFSTDGSLLVSSCGAGKTIRVWNVASREELARAIADKHFTRHSALSPDGTSIVSGGGFFFDREANKFSNDGDYAIRLWQLMTASSR